MNILLLTSLYPDFKSTTYQRQTKALHNFTKYWVREDNVEVLVIKMRFYPRDEKKLTHHKNYTLDGVTIVHNYQYDKGIFYRRYLRFSLLPLYYKVKLKGDSLKNLNLNSLLKTLDTHSFKPDIILGHSMLTFQPSASLADKFHVPYILGFHKSDVLHWLNQEKWQTYINQYTEKANALVFRSPSVKMKAGSKSIIDEKPTFTSISGIRQDWLIEQPIAVKKLYEWKRGHRPLRFISVCNLEKLKNIDINLMAMHRLKDKYDFNYVIIGDGEERNYLEQLCHTLGLTDRVTFFGRLSHNEVLDKLSTSDIFIMVSQPETFGLAYLEAIAKGNLVIAARHEGIYNVFNDNEVIFTQAEDKEKLYTTLLNKVFLQDEMKLENMLRLSMTKISSIEEKKVALDYLSFIKSIKEQ